MKFRLYLRMKRFFLTTILGGLAAILPLALVIVIFRWIINLVKKYLEPIVSYFNNSERLPEFLVYIIALAAIIALFFVAGLIIKTRIGRFVNRALEDKYLMKIPGYKLAKETVMQFFGKNRSFFSEVVLVDVFKSGTLMTGFITDNETAEDFITVFIPTGPNPTSGNIYHVNISQVIRTKTSVDTGMKSIISCGAGSSEVFSKIKK